MDIDKTTLQDLAVFVADEHNSVFDNLNFTQTFRGKEQFQKNLGETYNNITDILAVQNAIKTISSIIPEWPAQISNGTLMVVEKYFDSRIDLPPSNASLIAANTYKLLNKHDYTLVHYSMRHCFDFLTGMQQLSGLLKNAEPNHLVNDTIQQIDKITQHTELEKIFTYKRLGDMPVGRIMQMAHFIFTRYKHNMHSLILLYARLDAWASMAKAMEQHNLHFPEFVASKDPFIDAKELFHVLLSKPVAYDVQLDKDGNFLFLTGANMAGKSTFIKAVGTAVYLAHTGMGVPATAMKLSVFDGMLSNINVIDNIAKGESYFFNEVQRIKSTIQKVNDGRKWLILIDELFKGTNVEDAMKCSTVVIEGLQKKKNALFVLSTHLYEIANDLKKHPNIIFNYFETSVEGDKLKFNYTLTPGISNDRLGYLILKKEGVVELLQNL